MPEDGLEIERFGAGARLSAGCSLALADDIVVAGRSAIIRQAFINIGPAHDKGATGAFSRLIEKGQAVTTMMVGAGIDAKQAMAWG
jgi:2-(1,2-epoxy-1,2-dihydrophenyl)acetyl-CoA isomerase